MPRVQWYLYLIAFAVIAGWETFRPRRKLHASTPARWGAHFVLFASANYFVFWLVPASAVTTAVLARENGVGLLDQAALPLPLEAVLGVVLLDFVRYFQHYVFHAVPPLWRIHQIHHADLDYDLTTGLRFHPIESLFLSATYLPVVWLLGAPPFAVIGYELAYIFVAFFVHGNVSMPVKADAWMRLLFVTPDMHRVHHSDIPSESRRNYSGLFSFWDRLFRTYQAQPVAGHRDMGIGLIGYKDSRSLNPLRILAWPFTDRAMGIARPKPESAGAQATRDRGAA